MKEEVILGVAILGAVLLTAGFLLFMQIAPQWQQSQSWLVRIGSVLSPSLQQQIESIRTLYFGSIGAILLGSILTLAGLLSPRQAAAAAPRAAGPWYENAGNGWWKPLTALGIIVLVLMLLGSTEPTRSFSRPAPMASHSQPAPTVTQAGSTNTQVQEPLQISGSRPSAQEARGKSSVREAANDLTVIRDLEWNYFQRFNSFSRNLRALGFSHDTSSDFVFMVSKLDAYQVTVVAKGRLFTPVSGLRLTMILNADGASNMFASQ